MKIITLILRLVMSAIAMLMVIGVVVDFERPSDTRTLLIAISFLLCCIYGAVEK